MLTTLPLVLPDKLWSNLPQVVLGERSQTWQKLRTWQLSPPPAAVILPSTWCQELLTQEGMSALLNAQNLPQARVLLQRLSLSPSILQNLVTWYENNHGPWVTLVTEFPSDVSSPTLPLVNIHGESNLVESLMWAWSAGLREVHLNLLKSTLNPFVVCPRIWLLTQPIANQSGWASTIRHETGKSWQFWAEWGSGNTPVIIQDWASQEKALKSPQHYWTTWQLHSSTGKLENYQIGTQTQRWQPQIDSYQESPLSASERDQAPLDPEQLTELWGLVSQLKRKVGQDLAIKWYRADRTFFITDYQVITREQPVKSNIQFNQNVPKLKLAGKTIVPGYIAGTARVINLETFRRFPKHTPGHHLYVVSQVTLRNWELLKTAKAIITEAPIRSLAVVKYLRQHGIPTISQVSQATTKLRTYKHLTMQAKMGQTWGYVWA